MSLKTLLFGKTKTEQQQEKGPVAERYRILAMKREPFLRRARANALLTIPALCPPEGVTPSSELDEPWHPLGSMGVKNIAEKIMMALQPPGRPFFRMSMPAETIVKQANQLTAMVLQDRVASGQPPVPPDAADSLAKDMATLAEQEADEILLRAERAIMQSYSKSMSWATDSEVMKHLVNNGSVLRYAPVNTKEQPRMFSLSDHVVARTPDGLPLEIITHEKVIRGAIPKEIADACGIKDTDDPHTPYDLYTYVKALPPKADSTRAVTSRVDRYEAHQELNAVEVPGSKREYPAEACPWIPLRWTKLDGEDYGRGLVDDVHGALQSLENLTRLIRENAAVAGKTIPLVTPNGRTSAEALNRARNGEFVSGHAEDVTFLQVNKYNDLQVAFQDKANLEQLLSKVFLLTESVQRQAERVTATEFQTMARELQTSLGGVYATLGKEYQLPLLKCEMAKMRSAGTMPELPSEAEPTIITGMDILSREAELEQRMQVYQAFALFPQQLVQNYLKPDGLRDLATLSGLPPEKVIYSEEEVQAKQQQQMQQAMQMQTMQAGVNVGQEALTQALPALMGGGGGAPVPAQ